MPRHKSAQCASAWAEAVSVHAHLMANGRLLAVEPPVPVLAAEPGEYAVGVFARSAGVRMTYARHYPMDVGMIGNPAVIIGTPQFVTGYVLGSVVMQIRARRRARREAAPQWRTCPLHHTVVTTCRLWCEVAEPHGCRWLNFNYDTISELQLDGDALYIAFARSEPLRLAGSWAPWCAAVIAHYRFGNSAAQLLPSLPMPPSTDFYRP